MNSDSKDILLKCIKTGGRVPEPLVNVKKLLESAKMELYTPICCNRIRALDLVDEFHIFQDGKSKGNLIMDLTGLEKCKQVIGGYIGEEECEKELADFQSLQNYATCLNNILYAIRKNNNKKLRELCREVQDLKETVLADSDISKELFIEELRHRKRFLKNWSLLKRVSSMCRLTSLFSVKLRAVPILVKTAWSLSGVEQPPFYNGGVYYEALIRFQVNHPRCRKPKRLKRDDLKKFVFLGVKAFGEEYQKNRRRSKIHSCEEIEWIYKRTNAVMKAIGFLTPAELIQLFPITKDFDGGKFGSKDYFWTIDKTKPLPRDKPIGTEQDVADLLWDYVNKDTELLFLNWDSSVMDLKTYCGEDAPYENYHGRRLKELEPR